MAEISSCSEGLFPDSVHHIGEMMELLSARMIIDGPLAVVLYHFVHSG